MRKTINIAVLLAGGAGKRLGAGVPKQLLQLSDGRSVLEHAVAAFEDATCIDAVGIVMHPHCLNEAETMVQRNGWRKVAFVVTGGNERWESSVNALQTIEQAIPATEERQCVNVLMHDAARPFVSRRIIADVCHALEQHEAVTVAIPATDTIYATREHNGRIAVADIPDRARLMCAQTPQGFRFPVIAEAYRLALQEPHLRATDDCGILQRYRPDIPICIVTGETANRKITYKEDLNI
jgi:ribitol-5-phosphate 2-dehydrogenase (NADP+) / D-ribitol-5-phosphate cytidylyltransferase